MPLSRAIIIDSHRPTKKSITAPPDVEVTLPAFRPIYTYASKKLLIPYGIAILLTIFSVTIGFLSIYENGATYSDNVSTMLRIGKGMDIGIKAEDLDGKDPLPRYLAKSTVWLAKAQESPASPVSMRMSALDAPLDVALKGKGPTVRSSLLDASGGVGVHRTNSRVTL